MKNNKSHQIMGFNDNWFRIVGIPLIALFVPPVFFNTPFDAGIAYWISFSVSLFYTFLYWHICRYVFIIANNKFPLISQQKNRLKFIVISCSVVIIFLCPIIHFLLEPLLGINQGLIKKIQPTIFQIYAANVTMHLAIASIYESIRNFNLWETTSLEKEQIEKAHIASQLEGLKSQVNPHFLFNSLNTLVSIIPEDSERSVRFVRQLSKIYRYFLETTNEKTVPLKQEMDFVNAYTFLLKERFGHNLIIEIDDLKACEDCQIVPFSLQLLLENCIKHNIISHDKPLIIKILVNENSLVIKNNLQPKNQTQDSTGVGLKNIERRYALLSDKKVIVEEKDGMFGVTLPLL